MINRYSSRRKRFSQSFFNEKLKNAVQYDRIAGYFTSSIFEIAGEALEQIKGQIRVICNSSLDVRDVKTAQLAKNALRRAWCDFNPEELEGASGRFIRLYEFLKSEKLKVKVLPDEVFGLIHGKAGVVTYENGEKTSFLGSVNESKSGWQLNYELLWEDDSAEAVQWVQEEFDALWGDYRAVELSDFIIQDIKRLSERTVLDSVEEWRKSETDAPSVAVESPVYRENFGLWEHQKYFVDVAFRDHKLSCGARYVLADQVGLGKTIQLAMAAQLMALYGDKPILIIVPKTLMWQWQDEMNTLLDMPSAIWNGKMWVDENGIEYPNRGVQDIRKCPRRVGICSQGIIKSNSPTSNFLLETEYECVVVDESHRARRKNLGKNKMNQKADPNNLYGFLLDISKKTKSLLLATATPVQLYPIELWDLMNILSQKNDSILGSPASNWRKQSKLAKGLDLIMGKKTTTLLSPENWDWIRNPFPPASEGSPFNTMRLKASMKDDDFFYDSLIGDLEPSDQKRLTDLLKDGFFQQHNPYIRHVVRRERSYLENTIDQETNEPYLKKIGVVLFGEEDDEALRLSGYMKQAYEYAEQFCEALGSRSHSAGFLKSLLLKRVGSSMVAGKSTGLKMLREWNCSYDSFNEIEDETKEPELRDLTPEETLLLERFVSLLETNEATDPKYYRTVEVLRDMGWLQRGVIIFSQYFDTANWVAENLSKEFPSEPVGLYAGGDKSGFYQDGVFTKKEKEYLKAKVQKEEYRILVGTDSASEGLNLQKLGALINLDLPWNPTKLEQRKGRIQRIGQVNDKVFIYNMRYKDSVEDRVHKMLSKRLENIYGLFGQIPDVLEDVWINVAIHKQDEALKIIDQLPEKHPFENRYNLGVKHIDWESCSKVLNKKEKRKILEQGWR